MSPRILFGSPVLRPRSLVAAALGLLLTPALLTATPCVQPDASGTVVMPPNGCPYVSPTDFHIIINGLPAGTTIVVGVEHSKFTNVTNNPGGSLGGEVEQFNSNLKLHLQGTGSLSGYVRDIPVFSAQCETHIAPRTPGTSPQSFDTRMERIAGQITGDPDFDLLRVTAGNFFGMPSPGHTTLTQLPGGNWNVDSFFDVSYRIDFVGRAGGPLSGMSGSTTATIRMSTGEPPPPPPPCTVVDNGSGTVNLPPQGCGYVSPQDLHRMIAGLPPGTTINVAAEHRDFFNINTHPDPAGETENFSSGLLLRLDGTGQLAGFHRTVNMQTQCQSHTDTHTPGTSPQSFDTQMNVIQGQLPAGDPDFDLLRITGGSAFGMPSPGHTTLTSIPGPQLGPGGNWNVYSYFDVNYRIDFVGKAGGPLGGMSGSTTATIRMQTGNPGTTTSVPELNPQGPRSLKLVNRPNPFNSGTSFEYRLTQPAKVRLAVYDAAGKLVRNLTDAAMPAGPHAMYWDARNEAGRKVGAGTYFVKVSLNGKLAGSTKATVIK